MPRARLMAERDAHGQICGLVLVLDSGIVLPVNLSQTGRAAFLEMSRGTPESVRVVVGDRTEVADLWRGLERLGSRARLSRDQQGLTVDRTSFSPHAELPLARAEVSQLKEVVRASAAMAREEAQDDPHGRNPRLFETRIRERIERGRDFAFFSGGRVIFKTNVAALSPMSGQIEGIYTIPEARRRGLGLAGTSWVTRWVLERAARAFLLVNEDNRQARRVYERLGYRPVLDSRTIFAAP